MAQGHSQFFKGGAGRAEVCNQAVLPLSPNESWGDVTAPWSARGDGDNGGLLLGGKCCGWAPCKQFIEILAENPN